MRIATLALFLALLGMGSAPCRAEACQLQNVRTAQNQTICIYNCAGTIRTVTTTGKVCPVILAQ